MAKKKKNKKKINASKSNIRTFVQTITESWAIRKLEEAKTEVQNRNVSDKHVDFLVREIKEGRWVENGVPIILDEDGFLVDGQHRLWAIIKSGQPVRALIVQGVDRDDALPTIDLNRRSRNFADVLVMKNIIDKPVPQPRVVQAATKWLHKYRKRLIFQSAGKVSAGELEETLIKEPGLIEGLHAADMLRGLMPSTGLSCFFYYIIEGRNQDMADSFIEALATGANIGATSPILALRERLIDHKVKKERRSMEHIAFICMRAWLYYEAGLPLKRLPWRRQATEERPSEPFPYLADFPTDPKKLATLLKRGSAPKKVVKKATKKKATKKKAS